jgi:hypothetical protein
LVVIELKKCRASSPRASVQEPVFLRGHVKNLCIVRTNLSEKGRKRGPKKGKDGKLGHIIRTNSNISFGPIRTFNSNKCHEGAAAKENGVENLADKGGKRI